MEMYSSFRNRAKIVWTILVFNCIAFVMLILAGGSTDVEVLVSFGALSSNLISEGEYWRFITCIFLHANLMHLGVNAFSLFIFGPTAEVFFGRIKFLIIYLISGVGGSATSYVFIDPRSIGVGASGAVFGVLGSIAVYYYLNQHIYGKYGRGMMGGIAMIVLLNLGFGFTVQGVDNWAHIGGLLSGILAAFALQKHRSELGFGVFGLYFFRIIILALILIGLLLFAARDNPVNSLNKAQGLYEEKQYDASLKQLEKILDDNPNWGKAYLLKGKILSEYIDGYAGRGDLIQAVRLGDKDTRKEAVKLLSDVDN
ncbi:MAG: rhomboid family intramembrane serine protease [SAR202 cluster bacterium]|nr:rhomboid family intramembrane serine protease [SAR202 cluster bacterium]|tara:strand:+ start:11054 stop:11989 length:936 start_codon:yes stop_codon:yes gene_type:complete